MFETGTSADFDIEPATLFVNAQPASKTFGQDDPTFTYQLSGFAFDEDATEAGVTGEAACTRDPGEDAGNYTITCAPGTLDAANYVFASGDTAQLTINQAIADCSSIAGQTVTYDGDSHGATGNCTGVGGGALPRLDRGDRCRRTAGRHRHLDVPGRYQLHRPRWLGADHHRSGHARCRRGRRFQRPTARTTRPSPTRSTASSTARMIRLAGVTGAADCTREPGEDVGSYTITCAPGTLAAANYVFETGDTASSRSNRRPCSLTRSPISKTYGEGDPVFTSELRGFAFDEDATDAGVTGPPTAPANQARTSAATRITCAPGTLAAANYVFETGTSADFDIEPATLFVNAQPASKTSARTTRPSPINSAASPSTRTPPTPG